MPDLGIGEALAAFASIDTATAASIVSGAELAGGLGAITGGIRGGPLGAFEGGALGGITGGATAGFGPVVGDALGIGTTGGGALVGASLGAGGSALTKGNPLVGAAEGGVSGAISGAQSGSPGATSAGGTPTGGGTGSAGGGAAPAGVTGSGGDATFADPSQYGGSTPVPQGGSNLNTSLDTALSPASNGAGDVGPGPISQLGTSGGGGPNTTSVAPTSDLAQPNTSGLVSPSSAPNPSGGNMVTRLFGSGESGSAFPTSDASATGAAGNAGPSAFSTAVDTPTWGNIGTALSKNAGLLTAGAGFGNDIISALGGPPKGTNQLNSEAAQLENLATQNENYLKTGTLPPGVQAGLNQATQSAIAAIKSKYASMGMSGSSAEQQDIQSVTTNAQVQGANIAMNLMQQGASEAGLSSQIYSELIKNTMARDQIFSSAFTNLASVVGGDGSGGKTKGTITFG